LLCERRPFGGDARESIRREKQSSLDEQKKAVEELDDEMADEKKTKRDKADKEVEDTEKKVEKKYEDTEKEAEKKVAKAEEEAEEKKEAEKEKAEEQSWWDKATDWLQAQLSKLQDAISGIFDAVRSTVNDLIDKATEAVVELIDKAAEAIKELADDFATFAKGLVDTLLAETFPALAEALNEAIDSAVEAFKKGVDAAAEFAKKTVRAAAAALKKGLNAIIDAYEAALNAAFAVANSVLSMSFADLGRMLIEAALSAVGIPPEEFFALIDKAKGSLMAIIEDPAGFFANVGEALVGGIKKFTGNFVTHLKQAFISWLTGALSAIEMPEKFDLMGVLSIARQLLGLTWDYLKEKAAELIGEENVERLEWLIEQIRTLIEGGWGALLAKIKDQLTGLKDQIFDKIKEFILVSVVKKAVVKLASMFSPVGAVVQLVVTLWDVFQTLREQLSQIFEVVKTVVDALDKIVKGTLEPAQKKVEEVLAGVLPVAIGLLARLVGLGGLGKKVEEFIESIRERVDKAITKLINKIKAKIKKLFGKGKRDKKGKQKATGAEGKPELGETVKFSADGEKHRLWIDVRGRDATVMVASEKMPVHDQLESWKSNQIKQMKEAEDQETQEDGQKAHELASSAQSKLKRADKLSDSLVSVFTKKKATDDWKSIEKKDDDVESVQEALSRDLKRLFELTGLALEGGKEKSKVLVDIATHLPKFAQQRTAEVHDYWKTRQIDKAKFGSEEKRLYPTGVLSGTEKGALKFVRKPGKHEQLYEHYFKEHPKRSASAQAFGQWALGSTKKGSLRDEFLEKLGGQAAGTLKSTGKKRLSTLELDDIEELEATVKSIQYDVDFGHYGHFQPFPSGEHDPLGYLKRDEIVALLDKEAQRATGEWIAVFATSGVRLKTLKRGKEVGLTLGDLWEDEGMVLAEIEKAILITLRENEAYLDATTEIEDEASTIAGKLLKQIRDQLLYFVSHTDLPRNVNNNQLIRVREGLNRSKIVQNLYQKIFDAS
jgi:hypothetical protein